VNARKPGRPRLNEDAPKDTVLTIRLSREERAAIAAAAVRANVAKDSDWARRILLGAALER
jgi:hypothetical protein